MPKVKYRMVSLDTSSTKSGYAYWENGELIESGLLDTSKEKDREIRLEDMCLSVIKVLDKYKPKTVVIEMTVVERNAQTQRILSEIVGVVRGWTLCNYAEFVSMRPTQWRKLICDTDEKAPRKREECKTWSVQKARQLYNYALDDDNISDAILVGRARINFMCQIKDRQQAV